MNAALIRITDYIRTRRETFIGLVLAAVAAYGWVMLAPKRGVDEPGFQEVITDALMVGNLLLSLVAFITTFWLFMYDKDEYGDPVKRRQGALDARRAV